MNATKERECVQGVCPRVCVPACVCVPLFTGVFADVSLRMCACMSAQGPKSRGRMTERA